MAKPQRITFDHKAITGVAWTGDGTSLTFSSLRNGRLQLWRVAAEPRSVPIRLALTDDGVRDIAVSHDGKRLVYSLEMDDQNIWQASLRDGKVTGARVLIASTSRDTVARYSPDGKRIVFESNRSGSDEIWVCNADGSSCPANAFRECLGRVPHLVAGWEADRFWSQRGRRMGHLSHQFGWRQAQAIHARGSGRDLANMVARWRVDLLLFEPVETRTDLEDARYGRAGVSSDDARCVLVEHVG